MWTLFIFYFVMNTFHMDLQFLCCAEMARTMRATMRLDFVMNRLYVCSQGTALAGRIAAMRTPLVPDFAMNSFYVSPQVIGTLIVTVWAHLVLDFCMHGFYMKVKASTSAGRKVAKLATVVLHFEMYFHDMFI